MTHDTQQNEQETNSLINEVAAMDAEIRSIERKLIGGGICIVGAIGLVAFLIVIGMSENPLPSHIAILLGIAAALLLLVGFFLFGGKGDRLMALKIVRYENLETLASRGDEHAAQRVAKKSKIFDA